ncbi:MAG: MopE-related protein [Polyangiales bacterium]
MTVRIFALSLLCMFAFACSSEITRTQLTFQINAGPSVRTSIETLRVTVRSSNAGDKTENFAEADLKNWPVEIVVLPIEGNESTDDVTLIVSAFGSGGSVLAEQTARAAFKPERNVSVPVALGADAANPGPELDGGTPRNDARVPPERDTGSEPPTPGEEDASEPDPETCASEGTKIECDDGNPCNGEESCKPQSSNANKDGCVPSDSPIMCSKDMTCDRATGECSTCLKKPDGDGDGVDSISCGGLDCNDNDNNVAPGKPELCNNRDDDCDGTRDGPKADAACLPSAPRGGTASCLSGVCVGACNDKTYQIVGGVCVPPPAECPAANPCLPGSCSAGSPSYICTCPQGYRAGRGMTRCAPVGIATRTLGFEKSCADVDIPSTASEFIPIVTDQFAACGVNSITGGAQMVPPTLVRPLPMSTTVIAGLTSPTVLEVPHGMSTTSATTRAELAIGFSQLATEVAFNILDVDNLPGLTITLRSGMEVITPPAPVLTAGTQTVAFKYLAPAKPVDLVVITYTPALATELEPLDRLFIDDLSHRIGGCGDKVIEGVETCDDGNAVQCDGCDNACAMSGTTPSSCGL